MVNCQSISYKLLTINSFLRYPKFGSQIGHLLPAVRAMTARHLFSNCPARVLL